MGFFISVAGGICRESNGAELREAVSYGGLYCCIDLAPASVD